MLDRLIPDRRVSLAILGTGLALLIWQVVAISQIFGTTIAPPTEVVALMAQPGTRDTLISAGLVTGQEAVKGLSWAVLAAIIIGVTVHVLPPLRGGVDQLATALSAIPFVALAPILIATISRDQVAAAMAACTAFFSLYVAVVAGLVALPRSADDVFTVLGSNWWRRLRYGRIPSGAPVLATGLKVATPLAIVGTVIGEWFGASTGLGPIMLVATRNYQMTMMWAGVVATVIVALTMYSVAALIERIVSERLT